MDTSEHGLRDAKHLTQEELSQRVKKEMKARVKEIKTRINIGEHEVSNVHSTDFPRAYPKFDSDDEGDDGSWNLDRFKQNFQIHVGRIEGDEMEFDMIGIDAALANAFRRILLTEVPTMAVDKVCVYNNTSVIPDEILAQRLGLVPFKADPRLFEYRSKAMNSEGKDEGTSEDTLEFKLQVRCQKSNDRSGKILHQSVTTDDIKWIPIGDQAQLYKAEDVGPVHLGDQAILLAKLAPGQEIDIVMYCVKGIGSDHAKFSPVATAAYRLLPEIVITETIEGDEARKLQTCFPPGVIEIDVVDGREIARVANSRKDLCNREFMRDAHFKECVKLRRIRNHFIFSVESTGALPPQVLVVEAIKVLKQKCEHFMKEITDIGK